MLEGKREEKVLHRQCKEELSLAQSCGPVLWPSLVTADPRSASIITVEVQWNKIGQVQGSSGIRAALTV